MQQHLFGLTARELSDFITASGEPMSIEEARRVLAHVVTHGRDGHPTARPVAQRIERAVECFTTRQRPEIIERATDPSDGFVKYLFRYADGAVAEAVRIPLEKPGQFTICLSSQVGCAMRCDFCATGRLGLSRNLETWEIVAQFVAVRDEAPGRVTGAVFQGQGEPLHNYDNVIKAARILADPCGGRISAKGITISTVGLVPAIKRYAEERHPYRLIVSLTSAVDERRRSLLPAAAAWDVKTLAEAIRTYQSAAGTRMTIAWVLLGGINHDQREVDALRELFAGVPIKLNLIDVNDAREDGFRRATEEELNDFRDRLRALEAPVVRRYSGGAAKHAACGMLAAMREEDPERRLPGGLPAGSRRS